MRQAVLSRPKTLSWHDEPTPQPGKGEVLVKIRAALTCGTDLKTYRRGHPKLAFGPFGHEASGDVAVVGAGVKSVQPGEPVMWVQTAPCGECARCTGSTENLCERLTDVMALGAYADYIRLPAHVVARNLFSKPQGLGYIEAAFLEPFSCVVHGWNVLRRADARAPLPTKLAIIGAGSIGLLHLVYARRLNIPTTVFARHPNRLELAAKLGARATFVADFDSLPTDLPASFPAVIESGGTPESWQEAVRLTAPGGRALFFSGLPQGSHVPLDATRTHYEELTLLGSFHFTPADVREARDLLVMGVLPARELISGVLPLGSLAQAFEQLDRRDGFKYALIPPPDEPSWV
ncbi:MAG: alcohol dehydrogenase catalytic domain-containing protein [Candidatus Eremiobacteraeota bacterium]|nr:alcohol dehydrogenase catalytic domain-containing protein [Candidatus Eremiobacteraeota bacterium]